VKLYKAIKRFWMGELDTFSPEDNFSKILCNEIIGVCQSTTTMIVKGRAIPITLPNVALQYLQFVGIIPDTPDCACSGIQGPQGTQGSGGGGGGTQGPQGDYGPQGPPGVADSAILTAPYVIPTIGSTSNVSVSAVTGYSVGSYIILDDGSESGLFIVTAIPGSNSLTLRTVASNDVGGTLSAGIPVNETGFPAYTYLMSGFTIPALASSAVANVAYSTSYTVGEYVVVNDGVNFGYFKVTAKGSGTLTLLTMQSGDVGNTIISGTVLTHGGVAIIQRINIVPDGLKDGVNTTFTIPGSESYIPGTLISYLNGIAYQPVSITENGPAYTIYTIAGGDVIPDSSEGDILSASFVVG